jgi:hypothetical protein
MVYGIYNDLAVASLWEPANMAGSKNNIRLKFCLWEF